MSVVVNAIEDPLGAAVHWSSIDWPAVRRHVSRLQARIVKAIKAGQWRRARLLQRLLANSFYAKLLAVERISRRHLVTGCFAAPYQGLSRVR